MNQPPPLTAILAAVALTAAVVYVGLPVLMGVPVFASFVESYVLHPQEPLFTGIVIGLGFALVGLTVYFFYGFFKPSSDAVHKLETDAP